MVIFIIIQFQLLYYWIGFSIIIQNPRRSRPIILMLNVKIAEEFELVSLVLKS